MLVPIMMLLPGDIFTFRGRCPLILANVLSNLGSSLISKTLSPAWIFKLNKCTSGKK